MKLEEAVTGFKLLKLTDNAYRIRLRHSSNYLQMEFSELPVLYQDTILSALKNIYDCYNRIVDFTSTRSVLFNNDIVLFFEEIKKTPIKIKHILEETNINKGIFPSRCICVEDIEKSVIDLLTYLINTINRLIKFIINN